MKVRLYRRLLYFTIVFIIAVLLTLWINPYTYYFSLKYICLDQDCDTIMNINAKTKALCEKYEFYNTLEFKELLVQYKRLSLLDQSKIRELKLMIANTIFDWFCTGFNLEILQNSFDGQGLVFTVDDHQLKSVYISVLQIRRVHKQTIPIHVYYTDYDLDASNRNSLKEINDVYTHDLFEIFDESKIGNSYNRNTLALLAAPCVNCILIEDSLLFQTPEYFFSLPTYKETGIFMFSDSYKPKSQLLDNWLQETLPGSKIQGVELDGGVLVLNKDSRLITLLAAVFLDTFKTKVKEFTSEKDAFWIGSVMVNQEFVFDSKTSVPVGTNLQVGNTIEFCTISSGHFDKERLVYIRHTNDIENIQYWIKECSKSNTDESNNLMCMTANDCLIETIDPKDAEIIAQTVKLWSQ
ncbi:hypothetical protein HDV06_001352 [Boothiomyces sp. JEL0866]|nr:hypothetical protein HDV06_001352 [Boothiomyces sp. JEL0866]